MCPPSVPSLLASSSVGQPITVGDVMRYEGFKSCFTAARAGLLIAISIALAGSQTLAQERVFVTDGGNAGDTLLIMDTSSMPLITPIEVGLKPSSVAVRPDGAFAYTANTLDGSVSVVDIALQSEVDTIPIGLMTGPNGIAVTPDGSEAWVANRLGNFVSVIDLSSNTIAHTIPIAGNPHSVAITPNGAFAFTTKSSLALVAQINALSDPPAFVRDLAVAGTPQGLAISPNGQFLYVCNTTGNSVSVYDISLNPPAPVATIPLTGGPIAVTFLPNGTRA
jgi:YVTN family beta-propeller protein